MKTYWEVLTYQTLSSRTLLGSGRKRLFDVRHFFRSSLSEYVPFAHQESGVR